MRDGLRAKGLHSLFQNPNFCCRNNQDAGHSIFYVQHSDKIKIIPT